MIQEARGCIDYDEGGEGASTVVFVPGSCSTGAAWRPIISEWEGLPERDCRLRWVTTSLLGYGRTAERRSAHRVNITLEAEIVEAVIRRADSPVHLVGHSFGAASVLAVALRSRVPLLSLTLIEPPVAELLRHRGEHWHYRAFRDMSDAYFAAFKHGEADAIGTMIDFYGGAGTFASWPERARRYAIETTAVNMLDWASAYGFEVTPASLASIDIAALVICGGNSHPAMQRVCALLARHLHDALETTIPGAAHFMISTHAREVARQIARHVTRARDDDARSPPALVL